jgi:predicted PurR-regulated permease PerM
VAKSPDIADPEQDWQLLVSGDWVRTALPDVMRNTWTFIKSSVGGFLGVFGFLLSMVIVPVYLYYFLIESRHIAESWGDYLPLRASAFKDEVVSVLSEINGYLIAFFRGQLVVSLINGTATGLGLVIVGLDFGLLIGLLLCVLGIIPYLGIIICWIPAVIIASVQGGAGTWIPGDPWWIFPLVVTGIFVAVQQVDGLFITPKIVGESVGLHPMTVIVSVFAWTLMMGGLLGAIVAVPMTATLKVLLRRYIWRRKMLEDAVGLTEESFAIQQATGGAENSNGK